MSRKRRERTRKNRMRMINEDMTKNEVGEEENKRK
jgi:hypothetical protein